MPSAMKRLHDAVHRGDTARVRKLLDDGGNVNAQCKDGLTAAHLASRRGRTGVLGVLLAHGADVNAKTKHGRTPVHAAAESGRMEALKVLLANGADANATDADGLTPIHVASKKGHIAVLEVLVANGADANAKDGRGMSPLHLAVQNGHAAVAEFLVTHGADINANGPTLPANRVADVLKVLAAHGTDVHYYLASKNHHADVLAFLFANGADVNVKNADGLAPIHVAARKSQLAVIDILVAHSVDIDAKFDGRTALFFAARDGREDVLKVLMAHGAKVDEPNANGCTAAYVASEYDNPGVLELLFANGADVNARNNDGFIPIHVASDQGSTKALDVLLANGADIHAKSNAGRTALHLAAEKGRAVVLEVLLAKGSKVSDVTDARSTPLHAASKNGHTEALKILLTHGADVNAKDNFQETPAHLAADSGHVGALKLLVANGADVNAKNSSRRTPAEVSATFAFLYRDCTAYWAEVAKQTLPSLRKELYDTQCELSDCKRSLEMTKKQLDAADRMVQKTEGAAESSLTALFTEASAVLGVPRDWASPHVDPAADAQRSIDEFVSAREALTTAIADAATTAADPAAAAERRAACCTAATALLCHLTPAAATNGIPATAPRPPQALIGELSDVVAVAKTAYTAVVAALAPDVSAVPGAGLEERPIKATAQAALAADGACAAHVDAVRAKLSEVHAVVTAPTVSISAEECARQRSAAETVLESEGPWAGDGGLRRREAAIVGVRDLVARRTAAQRTFNRKDKLLAIAKVTLAIFDHDKDSDNDEADEEVAVHGSIGDARAAFQKAETEQSTALSVLLAASAAVQDWATVGEGALALKAFPGDSELTAAMAELFEADFKVHTELPRTPGVRLDMEYPAGLVESPTAFVFYAERVSGDRTLPVVLRRLRLSSPDLVQEAQRQVRDAGRIAVGLQTCPDAAAGYLPVVKATRWFLAAGPCGSTTDAWLEFPRAKFGSLAECFAAAGCTLRATAATGLCMRLARAVAQLHAAGIRHGDLNPSNVVLWDDPSSDVVRPGIIDLLDTAVVGATRTLRGATLEWLPPEAVDAVTAGKKAHSTRELDCWQLGRVCEAILDASSARPDQLAPVRTAAEALCVAEPCARSTAAAALHAVEAAVAGAAVTDDLQWALPPALWRCERGAAPGVDFVELDPMDPAAVALTACATKVGRRVRKVHRLENVRLWHVYAAERARVAEEAQGAKWPQRLVTEAEQTFAAAADGREALVHEPMDGPGEALLLHGAPGRSHRLIAEGGLDPSYSGERVGAVFGAATCLTPSWEKAANEYAGGAGAGVFVTRAAVGCVADCLATPSYSTRDYRRPPDGCHSVLGGIGTPGTVVAVYRPSRMYPEYLVVFDD